MFNDGQKTWAFALLVLMAVAPALYIHFTNSINYDIAWLSIAAERLLRGGSILMDAYETNPPLSILFMVPPVLLSWLTPLPIYIATTLYSTLLIGLSVVITYALLQRLALLETADNRLVALAYVVAMTVFPGIDYGERDHLVMAGVFPFLLWQLCLLNGCTPQRWVGVTAMVFGAFMVLLKPHYGLLPTVMILHRMIVRRSLRAGICAPDFSVLAAGVIGYIAAVFLFFPDFFNYALPDALTLYTKMRVDENTLLVLLYTMIVSVFLLTHALLPYSDRARHRLTSWLFFMALLCLVPYGVQGKNFWYHLMPGLTFFFMSATLMLRGFLGLWRGRLPMAGMVGIMAVASAYTWNPPQLDFPDHAELRDLPLTRMVASCPAPCSFFMINTDIGIIHPTAIYAERVHGSRFPSLWFLPVLLERLVAGDPTAEADRTRFSRMMAEDFARHQPTYVFVIRSAWQGDMSAPFPFIAFFADEPAFAAQWEAYEHDGEITIDNADYYRGTILADRPPITFDIYRRRGGAQ